MGKIAKRLLIGLALLLWTGLLVRSAWVCDDAYITFRVVDNWVQGFGLRFNAVERVQAYTNPLWLFVVTLAYKLSGDVYYTAIAIAISMTLGALALLACKIARDLRQGVLVVALLALSKAFVDYSTSGLENPLLHLMLALVLVWHFEPKSGPKWLFKLCFAAALAMLVRLDALWLVAPPVLYSAWAAAPRAPWRERLRLIAKPVLLGFSPLGLWFGFSLVYYGSFVPNTAYAKITSGIPLRDYLAQGAHYFEDSLRRDPLTLPSIALALVLAKFGTWRTRVVGVGIALDLVYLLRVGGDHMSGRMLTAALFCGCAMLATIKVPRRLAVAAAIAVAALVVSWRAHFPSFVAVARDVVRNGIGDNRWGCLGVSDLWSHQAGTPVIRHEWAARGVHMRNAHTPLVRAGGVGFTGFYAGPGVHVLDIWALSDPLLARLPFRPSQDFPAWRPGHIGRVMPVGYYESLPANPNQILDPSLAAYYDALRVVTRGPLFSGERWRTIAKLNLGGLDRLRDEYVARSLSTER